MVVTAAGAGMVQRAADVLAEHEIAARAVEEGADAQLAAGVAVVTQAAIGSGFLLPES